MLRATEVQTPAPVGAVRPGPADEAVGHVIGALVASSPVGPDDIARAVLEGVDRGEELILPDEAARAAYRLKTTDRAAYDQVMRAQAAKLNTLDLVQYSAIVVSSKALDQIIARANGGQS